MSMCKLRSIDDPASTMTRKRQEHYGTVDIRIHNTGALHSLSARLTPHSSVARVSRPARRSSTRRPEQPPQGRGQSASGSPRASTRAETRRHPPDPTVGGWHRASERPPRARPRGARPRGARRRATAPTRRLLPCGCAVQLAGAAAPGATTVIGLANSAASPGRTAAAASVISVASCAAAAVPTPSGTS